MKKDQILTLHPTNGTGSMLPIALYEMTKQAIVEVFLFKSTATLEEITAMVKKSLQGKTEAEIVSIIPIVNLDLEARDYIEPIPKTDPVQFQLKLIRC